MAKWLAAGIVLVAGLLTLLPFVPGLEVLTWGLVTAVPLAVYVTLSAESVAIPIFTPAKAARYRQPQAVYGDSSSETIQSQMPLLECLADGIIFSGIDGAIVYANQAAANVMGQSTSQLIGSPVTDVLTHLPMLAAGSESETDRANWRLRPGSFELNGRIIQGHMTIVYDMAGVAQGTVAILRDVTTEYQAERSRDGFLTTISHELRTPLTAIKGYAELLNGGAGGPLTVQQKMFLATILRNVTRMVQLINSLIFASAVKGGRLEFTSNRTHLPQLINQITREMAAKAAENGQQIAATLDSRLGVIQADPMHVATILEELLSNAIKFNKSGGAIQLQATLQADEAQQQEFVVISIQDEGLGIAPEDQGRIFEDFFHPDEHETQVRAGGVGMGLSIVRALVEAYNGRLWLESVPGRGSTFYFLLPLQQTEGMGLETAVVS